MTRPAIDNAVVTDVITYFHLASALSFCLAKKVSSVTVTILPALNGSYLIPDGDFHITGMDVRIQKHLGLKQHGGMRTFLLAMARRLYCALRFGSTQRYYLGHHTYFKPNGMAEKLAGHSRTFTFEEGIGTYGPISHHIRVAKREALRFPILRYVMKRALATRPFVDEHWTPLLSHRKDQAKLLGDVFGAFPEAFGFGLEGKTSFETKGKPLLFFTAPLVELGLMDKPSYASLLKDIEADLNKAGVNVIFKPHPLEKNYARDVPWVESDAPSEVIIPLLKPDCVGGFSTGALITSKLVFGLPSLCFNSYLPRTIAGQLKLEGYLSKLFDQNVLYVTRDNVDKIIGGESLGD